MPARSTVSQLPAEVREALDRRLIEGGFSDYTGLTDWLAGVGFTISRSAVHRHGAQLERRIEQVRIASEEARAIEAAVEDEGESIAFGILTQCQVMLHRIALAADEGDPKLACQQARALADLTRAGISLRKERKLGHREGVTEAAGAADDAARKAGVSPESAAVIRAAIEGLA